MNLLSNSELKVCHAGAVAGSTDITDAVSVDMQGYDGVMFIAQLGALTSSQVTKLAAYGADADTNHAALSGAETLAAADADSDKLLILDVVRPLHRYIKPVLKRGTANAVLDGIIAIRYRVSKAPVTQGSTVSKSLTVASPELA